MSKICGTSAWVGFINILVTTLFGIFCLISSSNCEQIIPETFTTIVYVLSVISFINMNLWFIPKTSIIHWFLSILTVLLFLSYAIFGLKVSYRGGGEKLLGKAYKEYRLSNYSNWMQKRVNNTKRWDGISMCLVRHRVCKKMTKDWANITVDHFYIKRLSSIESGCCKPSNDCNFNYISPTNWTKTANSSYTNPDCNLWFNEPNVWCFGCQSCKAGVADKFKHNWYKFILWQRVPNSTYNVSFGPPYGLP